MAHEVLFYHLTRHRLEQALPALVDRASERGWKSLICLGDADAGTTISDALWTFRPDAFLAHGLDGREQSDGQPVWITPTCDDPIDADVRFCVAGADPTLPGDYQRTITMFDGHDQGAVEGARAHWKTLREAGAELTYWQQDDEGRWGKKA